MTSKQNKFHVSPLVLAFQLFLAFRILLVPLTANGSDALRPEMLVIMASGINVTSIYDSFSEFRKMFGVELPDDRRIVFESGEGEFINIRLTPTNRSKFIVDVWASAWDEMWCQDGSCMKAFIHEANPFSHRSIDFLVTFLIGMLQAERKKAMLHDDGAAEAAITIKIYNLMHGRGARFMGERLRPRDFQAPKSSREP